MANELDKYIEENKQFLNQEEPKQDVISAEKEAEDYIELEKFREENKGLAGVAKTFIGQAADEALFGIPEIAAENLADPKTKRKIEILKEENPTANVLGGITGFLGGLAVGSPLFKAATSAGKAAQKAALKTVGKEISSKLLRKNIAVASKLATEGAVIAAPSALAEAVTGNPRGAVERIIAGGAGNAILGGAFQGVKFGLDKTKAARNKVSDFLGSSAEKLAEKATGATGKQLEKFKPGSGRELLDEGYVTRFSSPRGIANKLTKKSDELGKKLGDSLQRLDDLGARVEKNDILDALKTSINKLETDPSQAPILKQIDDVIVDVINNPLKNFTLTQAENIKRGFQQRSNYFDPEKTKAVKAVAKVFQEAVENSALKNNPELAKQFKEAKKLYGLLAPIEEAAIRRANQLQQSPVGGLLDTASVVGGLATGNPAISIAAPFVRKEVAKRGASFLAKTADDMSKFIKNTDKFVLKAGNVLDEKIPNLSKGLIQQTNTYSKEQLEDIYNNLSFIENQPEDFMEMVQPETEVLGELSEESASLYSQKIQEIASYIKKAVPKNPNSVSTPFRKQPWKPTDLQISKFNRVKKAALEPQSVLEDIQKGILTSDSVNTVRDLYPELSKDIDMKIMELLDKNPQLSYSKKQQIQLLLKTNYLPEYEAKNIKALQGNLAKKEQPAAKPVKEIKVQNISTDLNKSLYQK